MALVTVDTTVTAPSGPQTARLDGWRGLEGGGTADWLGIFTFGDAPASGNYHGPTAYVESLPLDEQGRRRWDFLMPAEPGIYEVRYELNNFYTLAAVSPPITVMVVTLASSGDVVPVPAEELAPPVVPVVTTPVSATVLGFVSDPITPVVLHPDDTWSFTSEILTPAPSAFWINTHDQIYERSGAGYTNPATGSHVAESGWRPLTPSEVEAMQAHRTVTYSAGSAVLNLLASLLPPGPTAVVSTPAAPAPTVPWIPLLLLGGGLWLWSRSKKRR